MSANSEILKRNNVTVLGEGKKTLLLANGFGCDQNMWRFLLPYIVGDYKVVRFDYVGSGKSDVSKFDQKNITHWKDMPKTLLMYAWRYRLGM